ncbi:Com family DNA-binding transcriptional regulator [Nitratireductor sp. OM-1]|uniref:Com family DNA-binding transcriptional regulator n=1 Tax=Nitratireductor sp. OM-1 TaxID=1756988 RepID=UPI000DDE096F
MKDVRCGRCRALLFRANNDRSEIEIKCRRCGTINHLRPAEPEPERQERPPRESSCGSISPRNASTAG